MAKVQSANPGAGRHTLGGYMDRVSGVAFDSTGALLATTSEDQTVHVWDARTGAAHPRSAGVNAVEIAPPGGLLTSSGAKKS